MQSLLYLLKTLIDIYQLILIAYVVMGLLVAFGVINMYNRFANVVYEFLTRATEPVLRPIRKLLPNLGPIDISPLIVLVGLWFLRNLLDEYWPRPGASLPSASE